ncbi:MAG: integrase core domain-containing protein [Pseudomonadota bacterium]
MPRSGIEPLERHWSERQWRDGRQQFFVTKAQALGPDITYIPMRRGFLYPVAIIDWDTRKVLAWRTSNTLAAAFCVEVLKEAMAKCGMPLTKIADQRSQFTSSAWTDRLRRSGMRISSMDGKGRFLGNVFVERLWRSLKYECILLHAWETGSDARAGITKWVAFYNHKRPHIATPPAAVYCSEKKDMQPRQQGQN